MQTQNKPISQKTKPTKPARPSRPRRLIPVLAGAAAVIVALVIGVVALSSDQDPVSQYADAAAAGQPDAIFGLFMESYRTGDVEGALPYVDADLSVTFSDLSDAITWMPGVIEFEGALHGRDEPGPSVCEGPDESGWLSCTFTEDPDGLLAAAGFPELTYQSKVADGRLVNFVWPTRVETIVGAFDNVERLLGEYAAEIDPEGMAAQCDVTRGLQTGELTAGYPVIHNQQCGAFLAGFLDDYQATLAEIPTSGSVSVVVPGNQRWTDTGIDLSIDDRVVIEADGAVTPSRGDVPLYGPDGVHDRPSARAFNLEGLEEANHAGLIGRIGEAGAPFLVGSRVLFEADSEGRLFLGINDTGIGNNDGEFTATITVNPS